MISIPSILASDADASIVPDWIKNTAKWYGDGDISENDFLNAIKYLIQQKIIVISDDGTSTKPNIVIPNGNSEKGSHGFYEPMHLDITKERASMEVTGIDDSFKKLIIIKKLSKIKKVFGILDLYVKDENAD
mgnify:CR=1 FL=1